MRSFLTFFWAALKNPLQLSTMFETGQTVAANLVAGVPSSDSMVVELGVGTGAITKNLSPRLGDPKRYVGLELNDDLIEFAQEHFPNLRVVKDTAVNFPNYLEGRPLGAVISSLPWTVMPQESVSSILDSIAKHLSKDGMFATYMTLHVLKTPAGRRFQKHLEEIFPQIQSKVIMGNLPPAKVFIARK